MGQIIVGWISVILALIALLPSIVPGAMSILGLLLSLTALILSVGSVRKHSMGYEHATLTLVIVGIVFFNDGLRLADPQPMPSQLKFSLYGLALIVVIGCWYVAKTIYASNRLNNSASSFPSPPSYSAPVRVPVVVQIPTERTDHVRHHIVSHRLRLQLW